MTNTVKRKKGFTLTELIIVIAIIGILAAVLIPSLTGYLRRSRVGADNSRLSTMNTVLETYFIENSAERMSELDAFTIRDIIKKEDPNATFEPVSGMYGYHFWFDVKTKRVILSRVADLNTTNERLAKKDFDRAYFAEGFLEGYILLDDGGNDLANIIKNFYSVSNITEFNNLSNSIYSINIGNVDYSAKDLLIEQFESTLFIADDFSIAGSTDSNKIFSISFKRFNVAGDIEPVTKIPNNAALGIKLAQISIPEGVTTIGVSAFADTTLSYVFIPDSVEEIMTGAFSGNDNITIFFDKTFTGIDGLIDNLSSFCFNGVGAKLITNLGIFTMTDNGFSIKNENTGEINPLGEANTTNIENIVASIDALKILVNYNDMTSTLDTSKVLKQKDKILSIIVSYNKLANWEKNYFKTSNTAFQNAYYSFGFDIPETISNGNNNIKPINVLYQHYLNNSQILVSSMLELFPDYQLQNIECFVDYSGNEIKIKLDSAKAITSGFDTTIAYADLIDFISLDNKIEFDKNGNHICIGLASEQNGYNSQVMITFIGIDTTFVTNIFTIGISSFAFANTVPYSADNNLENIAIYGSKNEFPIVVGINANKALNVTTKIYLYANNGSATKEEVTLGSDVSLTLRDITTYTKGSPSLVYSVKLPVNTGNGFYIMESIIDGTSYRTETKFRIIDATNVENAADFRAKATQTTICLTANLVYATGGTNGTSETYIENGVLHNKLYWDASQMFGITSNQIVYGNNFMIDGVGLNSAKSGNDMSFVTMTGGTLNNVHLKLQQAKSYDRYGTNSTYSQSAAVIRISGAGVKNIKNCHIEGGLRGIRVVPASPSTTVNIENTFFEKSMMNIELYQGSAANLKNYINLIDVSIRTLTNNYDQNNEQTHAGSIVFFPGSSAQGITNFKDIYLYERGLKVYGWATQQAGVNGALAMLEATEFSGLNPNIDPMIISQNGGFHIGSGHAMIDPGQYLNVGFLVPIKMSPLSTSYSIDPKNLKINSELYNYITDKITISSQDFLMYYINSEHPNFFEYLYQTWGTIDGLPVAENFSNLKSIGMANQYMHHGTYKDSGIDYNTIVNGW